MGVMGTWNGCGSCGLVDWSVGVRVTGMRKGFSGIGVRVNRMGMQISGMDVKVLGNLEWVWKLVGW